MYREMLLDSSLIIFSLSSIMKDQLRLHAIIEPYGFNNIHAVLYLNNDYCLGKYIHH